MDKFRFRKKTPLGNYRELPVPEAWLDVIEACKPFQVELALPAAPDVRDRLGQVFSRLEPRSEEMIRRRFGFADGEEWTLAALGERFGLTRERVRQLVDRAVERHGLIPGVRAILGDHWRAIESRGLVFFAMPEDTSLKNVYVGIARLLSLEVGQLSEGRWALFDPRLRSSPLVQRLREEPKFLDLEEAVALSGLNEYELIHCHPLFDGVFLTVGGKLGSRKWSMPDFIEALAVELAEVGIRDWHFSQMAQAMKQILPEEYGRLTSRLVASALARSGERFQHAGAKGFWRLARAGDGFSDTKEAVVSLLSSSDLPLHHTDLVRRLDRPVRPETLLALLSRESEFVNLGAGVFGLAGKAYPDPAGLPEHEWLLSRLWEAGSLPAAEVAEAAALDGLSIGRLRVVALLSKHLHFNQKTKVFERADVSYRRRFESWYYRRHEVGLPDDEVLAYGIKQAVEKGDTARLQALAQTLGWEMADLYRLGGVDPEPST